MGLSSFSFLVFLSSFPCFFLPSFVRSLQRGRVHSGSCRNSQHRAFVRGWLLGRLKGDGVPHPPPFFWSLRRKGSFWVQDRSCPGAGLLLCIVGKKSSKVDAAVRFCPFFKVLNSARALIKMEHKWTILRHCCWEQADGLSLIGKIGIDSPLENVLQVNCINGGLENHLGRQVLSPVVILVGFFPQISSAPFPPSVGMFH